MARHSLPHAIRKRYGSPLAWAWLSSPVPQSTSRQGEGPNPSSAGAPQEAPLPGGAVGVGVSAQAQADTEAAAAPAQANATTSNKGSEDSASSGVALVFASHLTVLSRVPGGDWQSSEYAWSEFENAGWEEKADTLTMTFVDSAQPALALRSSDDHVAKAALAIRERIQDSIVFQESALLTSGALARGMVRRDRSGELFTQVIVDGWSTPQDRPTLEKLESSLRDVVGL